MIGHDGTQLVLGVHLAVDKFNGLKAKNIKPALMCKVDNFAVFVE